MLGTELVKVFFDKNVTAWDMEDLDITSKEHVKEKVRTLSPDVIINAAAYNAVDKAEEEKEKANILNGYAPGYLAEIANDINATIVHYSTDYVFEGEKKEGYTEDDVPNPISAYGSSKFLGEKEVQEKNKKHYIIRLSRLFGKTGSGTAVKKSFADIMLDLAKGEKEIKVIDEEVSSPTYAPDLAKRTKMILETAQPFGIYHAANSGSCTWYEFAKEVFNIMGIEKEIVKISGDGLKRLAQRPQYSVLLNTKLPEARHWTLALRDYLDSIF